MKSVWFFSIGIELICQGLNKHSVFIKMWKKCGTLPYMWQLYLYMYLVLSTFMKFITWVVINMFCWIIVVSQRFIFFFWEEITENERLQKNYQVILVTLWLCLKLSTSTYIKVYQRKGSKDILDTVTLMVELKSSLEQIAKLT